MKQITIRIEDKEYKELKNLCEQYNIKNVSFFIRRSIDLYINLSRKEGLI